MADLEGTYHPVTPPFSPGPLGEPQAFGGGNHAFYFEQEVTLNTGGSTTTSSLVLPVGALVCQVTARITEAIDAGTNWAVGVATATSKFIAVQTTKTLGFTVTNCNAYDPAGAAAVNGPIIDANNTVLVTMTGPQNSTGKIRIGVAGFYFKPFTS